MPRRLANIDEVPSATYCEHFSIAERTIDRTSIADYFNFFHRVELISQNSSFKIVLRYVSKNWTKKVSWQSTVFARSECNDEITTRNEMAQWQNSRGGGSRAVTLNGQYFPRTECSELAGRSNVVRVTVSHDFYRGGGECQNLCRGKWKQTRETHSTLIFLCDEPCAKNYTFYHTCKKQKRRKTNQRIRTKPFSRCSYSHVLSISSLFVRIISSGSQIPVARFSQRQMPRQRRISH